MLDVVKSMKYRFQMHIGYDLFEKVKRIKEKRATPEWQRLFGAEFPDYHVSADATQGHADWATQSSDGSVLGAPQASFKDIEDHLNKLLSPEDKSATDNDQQSNASAASGEAQWQLRGPYVGRRLRIKTPGAGSDDYFYATVIAYLPPGRQVEDLALWRVIHDDLDVEDRDQTEVHSCLTRDKKLYLTPMHLGNVTTGDPASSGTSASAESADSGTSASAESADSGSQSSAAPVSGPAPARSANAETEATESQNASVQEENSNASASQLASKRSQSPSSSLSQRSPRSSPTSSSELDERLHSANTKQQIQAELSKATKQDAQDLEALQDGLIRTTSGWSVAMLQALYSRIRAVLGDRPYQSSLSCITDMIDAVEEPSR